MCEHRTHRIWNHRAGVVEIFNTNHDIIRKKTGMDLRLRRVVDLDIESDRGVEIDPGILSTDADDILEDPEIDIVIELIGGYEPPLASY